jgi:hypothetical protein
MKANSLFFAVRHRTGLFGTALLGPVALALLVPLFFVGTRTVRAAEKKSDNSVSETDKLQFTQKQVQALMQELQERMFHLSELIKQAEPDNATRLVLALRKAREELIIEEMTEILDNLGKQDLTHATSDTKQVLVKLDELKKLLVAADLEMEMQLERLRQLQAAIKKLDVAIKVEKGQKSESDRLAELQKKKTDIKPQTLDKAKNAEATNRQLTISVSNSVKALGQLDPAVGSLNSSTGSMASAQSSLSSSKPSSASSEQAKALKKLAEARKALEAERLRVIAELQSQVKQVVIQNLELMLERQSAIRETTQKLSPKLAHQREAVIQLQQLAKPEQLIASICQQTIDLVDETEFSVTLGPALEGIEKDMLVVSGDLTAGRGDERVIESQQAIEADLKDLIDTFKELPTFTGQPCSCCGNCKGNMNKLLAELKVVRMMQVRVNRGTVDADEQSRREAAIAELPPELRDKIGKLRDRQGTIRDSMTQLHERFGQ